MCLHSSWLPTLKTQSSSDYAIPKKQSALRQTVYCCLFVFVLFNRGSPCAIERNSARIRPGSSRAAVGRLLAGAQAHRLWICCSVFHAVQSLVQLSMLFD